MTQATNLDARLTDLWNRRNALNQSEWEELYRIVVVALQRRTAESNKLLKALKDEADNYIQDFFVNKIMKTSENPSNQREMTAEYLLGFYYNFLRDQRKKEKRELSNTIDADDGENERYQHVRQPEDELEFNFSLDRIEDTLVHHQTTRQQLTQLAHQFFDGLTDWQQQVLSLHLCQESAYAIPLSQLQEQYPQTATYYKVKQLGVIHSLRTLPKDYENTEIGRWITKTLNLKLCLDNYEILSIALQILCLVALQVLDD